MDGPVLIVGGLALLGIAFIVTRMFWLWYWRVDTTVRLLTEIRDSLRTRNVP